MTETTAGPVGSALSDEPLDPARIAARVADSSAGAVVSFLGVVRDHDDARAVTHLEYHAHPTASRALADVVDRVRRRHPAVVGLWAEHRVGPLAVGDLALVAAVSAPHRGEAFAAVEDLVETTKAEIPVWKHQFFADGSDEWVNSP